MSLKPICVKCQRFYRPKKNGIYFTEGMPKGNNVPPGTTAPEQWEPYKVWHGDLWICHGCGSEIIVGVGRFPVAEHYQEDRFKHFQKSSTFQVNDC